MPEGTETETETTAAAGQHAAAAPWSARIRVGTLVLIVGIVAAATVLIMQNSRGADRAIVTSPTSQSRSTPTGKSAVGVDGSGIGPVDAAKQPGRPKSATTPASVTFLAGQPTPSAIQGTAPVAPRSSAGAPSKAPPVQTSAPAPPSATPTPTPKPTPTKHCIPNTKICL